MKEALFIDPTKEEWTALFARYIAITRGLQEEYKESTQFMRDINVLIAIQNKRIDDLERAQCGRPPNEQPVNI